MKMDHQVRMAAFSWLAEQVRIHGDVLPRELLAQGMEYAGQRVPMLGPAGIFKPKLIPQVPLSITTTPKGPYDDSFGEDGFLLYRYRGTDPHHRDNSGLRMAFFQRTPLIYFHGVVPGRYLAAWPVFIVGDEPESLTFRVALEDPSYVQESWDQERAEYSLADPGTDARRAYLTGEVRYRLHQRDFRERVLHAYREQCAFCRLRHRDLLEAAHIIPDGEPEGEPIVSNGISLCKLHHAAFDKYFLGLRPDYVIEVRRDILEEDDGPMLLHGLQGLHLMKMYVPRPAEARPNPDFLDWRYKRFEKAI